MVYVRPSGHGKSCSILTPSRLPFFVDGTVIGGPIGVHFGLDLLKSRNTALIQDV
jgi:hypothetical protein